MIFEGLILAGAGFASSKAGLALIDKSAEALGALLKPWQLQRVAVAEGKASIIRAEADQAIAALAQRTADRQLGQAMREQLNIEATLSKALPNVAEDAQPEQIEQDWLAHFFDKNRLISNEDMQALWAQVLAGEVNKPGTFSARTLDFLATLSPREAASFRKVCALACRVQSAHASANNELYLFINIDRLPHLPIDIRYKELSHLADIGLFTIARGVGNEYIMRVPRLTISYHNESWDVEKRPSETLPPKPRFMETGSVKFTQLGAELASICQPDTAEGVLEYVAEHVFANCTFSCPLPA